MTPTAAQLRRLERRLANIREAAAELEVEATSLLSLIHEITTPDTVPVTIIRDAAGAAPTADPRESTAEGAEAP